MGMKRALNIWAKLAVALFVVFALLSTVIPRPTYVQAATNTFTVDVHNQIGALNHFWESSVGCPHQYLIKDSSRNSQLGSTLQDQLARARNEAGFKRERGHDILCDDVGIYSEDANGNPVYNWTNLDAIYDFLMSIDMDPLVNLAFMPGQLKRANDNNSPYYNYGYPSWGCLPKDWDKWHNLIYEIVKHCSERYGYDEVSKWYWEVWNEPEIGMFWSGTQDEAFRLYAEAAKGAKAANPNTRIGGMGFDNWEKILPGFLQYCQSNNVPLDFIAYHDYNGTGFAWAHNKLISLAASQGYPGITVLNTEWAETSFAVAGGFAQLDNERAAAFAAYEVGDFLYGANSLPDQSFAYWLVSDFFEESEYPQAPFLGIYGMITRAGLAKPIFNAYKMMHMMGDTRLSFTGGSDRFNGWASLSSDGKIHILIYNDSTSDQSVSLSVTNIPFTTIRQEHYLVDKNHSNAYTAWVNMGSPSSPTTAQWNQLTAASQLEKTEDYTKAITGTFSETLTAASHSVSLIVISSTTPPVNSPPVAGNNTYSTYKNTPLTVAAPGVLSNDTDADNNPLTAVLVSTASHGSLSLNSNGSFNYTPAAAYIGSDNFTYKANDGMADSNVATVTITVNNRAPVAANDSYSVLFNTLLNVTSPGILSNDTDADGDALTASLVTPVGHGSFSLNSDGSFSYTPTADYIGSDSFTYRAYDGTANSNTATATITVIGANHPPVAINDTYSTYKNAPLALAASGVLSNDTDADNNPLTAVLVSTVSHGSLTLNTNGSFNYTPTSAYFGSDNFTYKANDGIADSNVATVTIAVNNRAPAAANDSYSLPENTILNIAAPGVLSNDTDADGDSLTAALLSTVSHGTLTLNSNGSFTYTPTHNYAGSDNFTYRAYDGITYSNTANVTISVTLPAGTFGLNSGNGNTPLDVPNRLDAMRFQNTVGTGTLVKLELLVDDPTASGTARLGVYADNAGKPGSRLLDAGTVSIVNGWISISGLNLSVSANTYYWLAFTMNDWNYIRIQSGQPTGSHYSASRTYGALPTTYPTSGLTSNSTEYVMRATVNLGGSTPANNPPVAANDTYTTAEDTALTVAAPGVLSNDTDTDGDALTAIKVTNPSHGTVTLNSNGSFNYTPAANYNGSDSFTYKANDTKADSNTATVTITITAVNDAPVAANDTYSTTKNTALTVAAPGLLSNDTDVDGDSLIAIKVSDPSHGAVTLNSNGSFTYIPSANYAGFDSFTYKANDGSLDSNIATVSITITAVNATPVAANDSYTTAEDTALTVTAPGVLSNDTDADGDTLTAVKVTNPSHGTVTLNSNGSFTYTPAANYNGSDSFTYKANDTKADSNTATVTITITAVNDAPVAANDTYSTTKNTTLNVAAPGVLSNDTDADGDALTAVKVANPSHGTVTLNSNGSFTYVPTANYTGTDSFTYKANDSKLDSNVATVTITITDTVATFGLNSGNSNGNDDPNYLSAVRFQNTAATGILTKLELLVNDTTPNGKVKLGVYADSNGAPGALLLDAGEVMVTNGWTAISGLNLAVTKGTYYWLAYDLLSANTIRYQSGQAANSNRWIARTYGALPAQYPSGSGSDSTQTVMRATVSPGG
jgi:VCBS repeat-containing protein